MARDLAEADATLLIARLCQRGVDADTLRREVARVLRRVVPFDAACWSTTDPATQLITSALSDGLCARDTPRFFEIEYLSDGPACFRVLTRSACPVQALDHEHDDGRDDGRRELATRNGQARELRAAFVADGLCWGTAGLYRTAARPPFDEREMTLFALLGPTIAAGLRLAQRLHGEAPPPGEEGPGLVILSDDGACMTVTRAARALLAEIPGSSPADGLLPDAVYAVAAWARALDRGTADAGAPAKLRVRMRNGGWLLLYGAQLEDEPGAVARTSVIVERARGLEIAPLIVQAHELSAREAEVVRLVLAGEPSAAIARALCISPLTVQDHLKKVFDKMNVRSRRELVARVFTEAYAPQLQAGPLTP